MIKKEKIAVNTGIKLAKIPAFVTPRLLTPLEWQIKAMTEANTDKRIIEFIARRVITFSPQ